MTMVYKSLSLYDHDIINQVSDLYIMTMVYKSLSLYAYNDHGLINQLSDLYIMAMVYKSLLLMYIMIMVE